MSKKTYPTNPILIVDDEKQFLLSATMTLKSAGIGNTISCSDSRKVKELLEQQQFSIIVLDMMMPYVSGRELVEYIAANVPGTPVVVITAINEVETAVACMKAGAVDYIVKPADDSRLITTIRRAIELTEVRDENTKLKDYLLSGKLEHPEVFSDIITTSPLLRSIFQYIEAIAETSLPVLITGETGVGKELFSRSIHDLSRRSGNFVAVNVAGLDDTLFSDALFGHKAGAFTGAVDNRGGLVEKAAGGTLFLDEIGDLALETQVKLLRLLQEGSYYSLGSDVPKITDARIVVATNADLNAMQKSGKFRKDLFFRLKAHHINIPPLKDRKEDLVLLLDYLLNKAAVALKKKKPTAPRELLTLLKTYSFPGNVRELEGMVFDAVSQHRSGMLSMDSFKQKISDLPIGAALPAPEQAEATDSPRIDFGDPLPTLKFAEQELINLAMEKAEGNQTIAAQLLGMSRKALNNRLIREKRIKQDG